jgi:hypothetical protein
MEALWYLRGEESIQAFIRHADQITIVAPQVFQIGGAGHPERGRGEHVSIDKFRA